MPTIARIGPYRFFFFGNERAEPPHVHVQREQKVCKFWLHPVALAAASGYNPRELRKIEKIVADRREQFLESWCDFFQAEKRRPRERGPRR